MRKLVTALLAALLMTCVLAGLAALLVTTGIMGEEAVPAMSMVALGLGTAAGALYLTSGRGEGKLATCLLLGLLLFLLRILFRLTGGSSGGPALDLLHAALCILAGCLIGWLPKGGFAHRR